MLIQSVSICWLCFSSFGTPTAEWKLICVRTDWQLTAQCGSLTGQRYCRGFGPGCVGAWLDKSTAVCLSTLTLLWGCYITAYIMLIASFWLKRPRFSLLLMLLPGPPCPLPIRSTVLDEGVRCSVHTPLMWEVECFLAILWNNVHKCFIFHH